MKNNHLITNKLLSVPSLDPDSHKGNNGRVCIIGDSPLIHGISQLSALGAAELMIRIGSISNDSVYYCSTKENVDAMKKRFSIFIGIYRDELDEYLASTDVVLIGPGMMYAPQEGRIETNNEPLITAALTKKILTTDKRIIIDACSLQVIHADDLKGHSHVIITPNRKEMSILFGVDMNLLITHHHSSEKEISAVAEILQIYAKKYNITILLKGPIDIMADKDRWFYTTGGNAGMTKAGTGDILAGVLASLYTRIDDPLIACATASFLIKETSDELHKKYKDFYNAEDLTKYIGPVFETYRKHLISLN